MNHDKVGKLHEEFPLLFPRGSAGSCGNGWYDLLQQLCHSIQFHQKHRLQDRATLLEHIKGVKEAIKTGDWENKKLNLLWSKEKIRVDPQPWLEAAEREAQKELPTVVIEQIKEKFGGLRFYYGGGDDFIDGMVTFAESMSIHICEECGVPGYPRKGGWIKTLCENCAARTEEARGK